MKAKGPKASSIHLINPILVEGKSRTYCGRPSLEVVVWARQTKPTADNKAICKRCLKGMLAAAPAKPKAKHSLAVTPKGRITRGGKPIGKELERAIEKESKAMAAEALEGAAKIVKSVKRVPALAILGENCPTALFAKFKGQDYRAEVTPQGEIILIDAPEGTKFTSPSGAAMAITGKPVDGWTFWKYEKEDGTREAINLLRPEAHRFIPKAKKEVA